MSASFPLSTFDHNLLRFLRFSLFLELRCFFLQFESYHGIGLKNRQKVTLRAFYLDVLFDCQASRNQRKLPQIRRYRTPYDTH